MRLTAQDLEELRAHAQHQQLERDLAQVIPEVLLALVEVYEDMEHVEAEVQRLEEENESLRFDLDYSEFQGEH